MKSSTAAAYNARITEVTPAAQITPLRTVFFAAVVGLFIFDIFAPQVMLGDIARDLHVDTARASYVSTGTMLGYALGLLFVVPLADVIENRRLVVSMATASVAALGLAATTKSALALIALSVVIGAAASLIQVLVPLVGSLVPPSSRGRVLGNVMSGLLLGIMLSRPAATLITDAFGWRAFYALSAVVIAITTVLLRMMLAEREPQNPIAYGAAVASLGALLRREPLLRSRSLTAALVMAAFSMFWTAIVMRLTSGPFHLSARGVALFGLAGTAGAVVAPLAGRLGDRGLGRPATLASDAAVIVSLLLALVAGGSLASSSPLLGLALLVVAAMLLDGGAIGDQTLGRRAINLLDPSAIGRRNGLFVGIFFLGGAAGSALVGPLSAVAGFTGVCIAGALFGVAALVVSAVSTRSDDP